MTKNEEMLAAVNEAILFREESIATSKAYIVETESRIAVLNAHKILIQDEMLKERDGNACKTSTKKDSPLPQSHRGLRPENTAKHVQRRNSGYPCVLQRQSPCY